MCGITAFSGQALAPELVFKGLKKLEYRGYDSWGIAFQSSGDLKVVKRVGRIGGFSQEFSPAGKAIGHTRWATHGRVEQGNAHPLLSNDKRIAVVHNGIIENFQHLRGFLEGKGFRFESETDTEVIPNLIQLFKSEGCDLFESVRKTMQKLKGRYAFAVLDKESGKLMAARKGSPLVAGLAEQGIFLASDVTAFLDSTKNAVFLDDNELIEANQGLRVFDAGTGEEKRKEVKEIAWSAEQAKKEGFDFFMLKEILEQKESIARAVNQEDQAIEEVAKAINNSFGSFLIGCGTAGKVCLTGTYLFSRVADKHVNFSFGSEFPSYDHFLTDKTLMIAVSQSGETADTLEAIEAGKKKGVKVLSLINAVGSTMERLSDFVLPVKAGPEICVASTKATTGQLAIITLLAYACAGKLEEGKKLLERAVKNINEMLGESFLEEVKALARRIKEQENLYIIGRGLNYPVALEAAIKLQEVSYIHAEGFAGGELKHGPLALIGEGTPCIVLVAKDETEQEILGNAMEVKARGGFIIGISPEANPVFDVHIKVPEAGNASPIVNLVPVQLLAYYLSVLRGLNPDYPRNLAKSVTVK